MEAVLFGRFNLITIGHISYFKNILKEFEIANICITTHIKNEGTADFKNFYKMSDEQHKKNIN